MIKEDKLINKIQYLSYFVARAFIIAVFCFIILIFFCLVAYFIDMFICMKNGKYDMPLFNGYIIVSESMVPTININDAVIIKRNDNDNYNVGDIITFISSDVNYRGLSVTHRIIEKKSNGSKGSIYTTKGDNNSVADREGVLTENIYGKVLFIIPKIGYVSSFLSKPLNFFLCILVPVGLVILYDVFKISVVMARNKKAN